MAEFHVFAGVLAAIGVFGSLHLSSGRGPRARLTQQAAMSAVAAAALAWVFGPCALVAFLGCVVSMNLVFAYLEGDFSTPRRAGGRWARAGARPRP